MGSFLFPHDNEGINTMNMYETYKEYINAKYGKPVVIYDLVNKNITGTKKDIRQAPWVHELMATVHHPERMMRQASIHNISFYEYLRSM